MSIKSEKLRFRKTKKMRFFLMSQGSFNPKIRFLSQKVCPLARGQADTQTDRHTRKWLLWAPFQTFRSFSFNLSSSIGPMIWPLVFLKWKYLFFMNSILVPSRKLWIHRFSQTLVGRFPFGCEAPVAPVYLTTGRFTFGGREKRPCTLYMPTGRRRRFPFGHEAPVYMLETQDLLCYIRKKIEKC